jgi:glycerate kinase
LLLALGGSASTDGGAGMLAALGCRLLDARGTPIPRGARGLLSLASVNMSGLRPVPPGGAVILSDVTNPAIGPMGAAAIFGPQKGLLPQDVDVIDDALAGLAELLGVDPATPGSGAAGATALALLAWGATLSSGAEVVAEKIDLDGALGDADLVVTGEGRFDAQTASGKVAAVVADHAARLSVPVALVAGGIDAPTRRFADAVSLTDLAGSASAAKRDPGSWLVRAGETLAGRCPKSM